MDDYSTSDTLAPPLETANDGKGAMLAGRYQIGRLIGSGAMSEVWEARHIQLARVVAIKLLGAGMRAVADRLITEAQALARVRHPAVVEVYDCGTVEDGTPYIVMERLYGETLARAVRRGPLAPIDAVRLFVVILDGLAAAHGAGVIHRDVKPDNIFLVRDGSGLKPKLLDFGIARITDDTARHTAAGSLIGTPAYMSPEQFRGERCAEPADLWSATATLYETLVGQPPFGDENLVAVMHRVLEAPVPYPRTIAGLNGRLWSILARGLRKQPSERFPSAEAMRDALRQWLADSGGQEGSALVSPPSPRSMPPPVETAGRAGLSGRGNSTDSPVLRTPLDKAIASKLKRD